MAANSARWELTADSSTEDGLQQRSSGLGERGVAVVGELVSDPTQDAAADGDFGPFGSDTGLRLEVVVVIG